MPHLIETQARARSLISLRTREDFQQTLTQKVSTKMYCPQCGQQQASTEMRFCSRCGFPMGVVVELLAQGGVLKSGGEELHEQALSPRRRGVRQGVMMMIVGTVLVPILAILSGHGHGLLDRLVPLAAVICFAGGLMRILYATIFEQNARSAKSAAPVSVPPKTPASLNASVRASALPPPQSIPISDFTPRRTTTAELVPPPSVTESTTRLLDEEKVTRHE